MDIDPLLIQKGAEYPRLCAVIPEHTAASIDDIRTLGKISATEVVRRSVAIGHHILSEERRGIFPMYSIDGTQHFFNDSYSAIALRDSHEDPDQKKELLAVNLNLETAEALTELATVEEQCETPPPLVSALKRSVYLLEKFTAFKMLGWTVQFHNFDPEELQGK